MTRDQMARISGAALDYLAVSAVATIQLSVVMANWIPLVVMTLAGLVWTAASVLWFSPRLFREAWFERGIAEFGQATGVTATGLLLLRRPDGDCDPRPGGVYRRLCLLPVRETGIDRASGRPGSHRTEHL